ncbi:MAG: hypothetical protein AAFZ65_00950, partial [Planctomycetota bacterium]
VVGVVATRADHHPNFEMEYPAALARVACPPMGSGTPALSAARIEAATALEAGDGVEVETAIALYVRAGEAQRGLDVAQAWLDAEPQSVQARLCVGELSLAFGDVETAETMALRVTRRRPTLARGWKLKAGASLAAGKLEDAALAVAEGASLDPSDVELAVIAARVGAAAGDIDAAVGTLQAFLQTNPGAARSVMPVLDELLDARQ